MPGGDFASFRSALATPAIPGSTPGCSRRFARAYGTRVERLLGSAARDGAISATEVLPGLHEREIDYLRREEWAITAEDILFRRSKLGLHLPAMRPSVSTLARQHPVDSAGAHPA